MRWIMNTLVVGALVAVAAVYFTQQREGEQSLAREEHVRQSLRQLYEKANYHAALQLSEAMEAGKEKPALPFPVAVEPAWFGGEMPGNALAQGQHPWLDVAPAGDLAEHPPDPVLFHEHQAGVWYNPNNGVFRARAPLGAADAETLALYNRINGTELDALPRDADASRSPLAYTPGSVPATTLARAAEIDAQADQTADVFFGNGADFEWLGDAPKPGTVADVVEEEEAPKQRPTLISR